MIKRSVATNFWLVISIAMTSCSVKDQQIVYRDRITPRSTESRLDSLYRDSLMVFFEQGFNETLVKIRNNIDVVYEGNITTAQELQLATAKNLGSNKEVKEFSISIDRGRYIPIKITGSFKYVAVSYLADTVYIDYMTHYPMYD
jgi:hypothetical protein